MAQVRRERKGRLSWLIGGEGERESGVKERREGGGVWLDEEDETKERVAVVADRGNNRGLVAGGRKRKFEKESGRDEGAAADKRGGGCSPQKWIEKKIGFGFVRFRVFLVDVFFSCPLSLWLNLSIYRAFQRQKFKITL